jgi:hypothetical protein
VILLPQPPESWDYSCVPPWLLLVLCILNYTFSSHTEELYEMSLSPLSNPDNSESQNLPSNRNEQSGVSNSTNGVKWNWGGSRKQMDLKNFSYSCKRLYRNKSEVFLNKGIILKISFWMFMEHVMIRQQVKSTHKSEVMVLYTGAHIY